MRWLGRIASEAADWTLGTAIVLTHLVLAGFRDTRIDGDSI
jgi:hypothetical protein